MTIPDDWQPTAANINALPEPLRRYIHDLLSNIDLADLVTENALLKDEIRMRDRKIELLRGECGGRLSLLKDIRRELEHAGGRLSAELWRELCGATDGTKNEKSELEHLKAINRAARAVMATKDLWALTARMKDLKSAIEAHDADKTAAPSPPAS